MHRLPPWRAAACGLVVAVLLPVAADARTRDTLREGVRNPASSTATRETQVISGVRGERYGTRQSNTSTGEDAGGAAVYGCRRPTRECTRHVNLTKGPAAHFETEGLLPFTIAPNAVGMVPGLNAERVGGFTAAEIVQAAIAAVGAGGGAVGAQSTGTPVPGPAGPAGPAGSDGAAGADGEPGAPGPIEGTPAGGALAGTYPNPALADLVVTTAKIAFSAVGPAQLANLAVATSKLATGAVTSAKLADDAVTGTKIAPSAVATAHIAPGAVTSTRLGSGAVGVAQLAPNAVTSTRIAGGAVGTDEINDAQVQRRVSGTCPASAAAQGVSSSGALTCEAFVQAPGQVVEVSSAFDDSSVKGATVSCPAGTFAMSGGGQVSLSPDGGGYSGHREYVLYNSRPSSVNPRLWLVGANDVSTTGITSASSWRVIAYAYCSPLD